MAGNHSEAKQAPVHEGLEIQTCNCFVFIEDVTCHSVIVSSTFWPFTPVSINSIIHSFLASIIHIYKYKNTMNCEILHLFLRGKGDMLGLFFFHRGTQHNSNLWSPNDAHGKGRLLREATALHGGFVLSSDIVPKLKKKRSNWWDWCETNLLKLLEVAHPFINYYIVPLKKNKPATV